MASFTKGLLSGTAATDGGAFQVTTAWQVLHTGPTLTTSYDEIWIYGTTADTLTDFGLSIGWGGDASSNDDLEITQTITAASGYKLIIPGLILRGNATPLTVYCQGSNANSGNNVTGYVNHITA
tara:strand:+ start:70 stop:441 length:372 start_codon:yes stop_codon:yes gene_type:complete